VKVYYPGLSDQCREYAAALLPDLIITAREYGYALALHGSVARDLDLVAIPWIPEAWDAPDLVEALRKTAERVSPNKVAFIHKDRPGRDPEQKPHGRLAWAIHLGRGVYIDLSVIPKLPSPADPGAPEVKAPA